MNILNIIKATFVKLKNKEKLRSAKSAIVDSKDVFEGSNFIGKNAVVKDCQIGFAFAVSTRLYRIALAFAPLEDSIMTKVNGRIRVP